MLRHKLGVVVDCLKLGVKKGVEKAAELGLDGFQIYVTGGELAPWNLSETGRREFRHLVGANGLEISALCGELGKGFVNQEGLEERIDKTKQMLKLARDLKAPALTTHIAVIPADRNSSDWINLSEVMRDIGDFGDRVGVKFAFETGPEDAALMKAFLDSVESPGLAVNYDPANLVAQGFDHLQGVYDLRAYIVHTHAKDARESAIGRGEEVPLGEGDVQWPEYLARLEEIGYRGYLTIERERGDDPVSDITKAIQFLRSL